jgi:hypothetical protein
LFGSNTQWSGAFDETAEGIRELQALDGAAVNLEEPRRTNNVCEALCPRYSDVESIGRHQEVGPRGTSSPLDDANE